MPNNSIPLRDIHSRAPGTLAHRHHHTGRRCCQSTHSSSFAISLRRWPANSPHVGAAAPPDCREHGWRPHPSSSQLSKVSAITRRSHCLCRPANFVNTLVHEPASILSRLVRVEAVESAVTRSVRPAVGTQRISRRRAQPLVRHVQHIGRVGDRGTHAHRLAAKLQSTIPTIQRATAKAQRKTAAAGRSPSHLIESVGCSLGSNAVKRIQRVGQRVYFLHLADLDPLAEFAVVGRVLEPRACRWLQHGSYVIALDAWISDACSRWTGETTGLVRTRRSHVRASAVGLAPDLENQAWRRRGLVKSMKAISPERFLPPSRSGRDFNFWRDLPSELKMEVLTYLEPREIVRCSNVSHAWHKMCYDGQLWSILDTADFYQDIPADALVKVITQAGPFVRDLNLRGCVQLRERWHAKGLSDACRNLENISLEGCRIDRTSIHDFLYANTRLVHINLSGLAGSDELRDENHRCELPQARAPQYLLVQQHRHSWPEEGHRGVSEFERSARWRNSRLG